MGGRNRGSGTLVAEWKRWRISARNQIDRMITHHSGAEDKTDGPEGSSDPSKLLEGKADSSVVQWDSYQR